MTNTNKQQELYRKQWQDEWAKSFYPREPLIQLAGYLGFRPDQGFDASKIKKFIEAAKMPVRKEGYDILFTMLGAAHYCGLIENEADFLDHIAAWGMTYDWYPQSSRLIDWSAVWRQIAAGVKAYKHNLPAPPPFSMPAPEPIADPVPVSQLDAVPDPVPAPQPDAVRDPVPAPIAARRGISVRWAVLIGVLVVGLLSISAVQFVDRTDETQRLYARELALYHDSTQSVMAGAIITPATTLVPAQIFATATAGVATAAWVSVFTAQPTHFADGVTMVWVPPGCFLMGNYTVADSSPAFHTCIAHGFWMDRYKVANEQYFRVSGRRHDSRSCGDFGWEHCAPRPVESIAWAEASAYCALRGARLPTEHEWEYAARGPLSYRYPWGNVFDAARLDIRGQQIGQRVSPAVVTAHADSASWAGVVGLMGGVQEWTSSPWQPYPYSATAIPPTAEPGSPRVARGVAYVWEAPSEFEIANYTRMRRRLEASSFLIGFRCVRDAELSDSRGG